MKSVLGKSQKSCRNFGLPQAVEVGGGLGSERTPEQFSRSRDVPRVAPSDWVVRKGLTKEVTCNLMAQ